MPFRLKGCPWLLLGVASATLMTCWFWFDTCEAQQPTHAQPTHLPQAKKTTKTSAAKTSVAARKKMLASKTHTAPLPNPREIAVLQSAYLLLAATDNTYHGHKTQALSDVRAALNHLDRSAIAQIQPRVLAMQRNQAVLGQVVTQSGVDLSGAVSDSMVYNAGTLLGALEPTLISSNQRVASGHVQRAIREVTSALQFSGGEALKGKEANVLTGAYVLLAAANHDYSGHRATAMGHVEAACNILERDLLRNGTVQKKVNALKDANAKVLVKVAAPTDAPVHETQTASDTQMLLADALIQRVAFSLDPTRQRRVLSRLANAHGEIGTALLIQ